MTRSMDSFGTLIPTTPLHPNGCDCLSNRRNKKGGTGMSHIGNDAIIDAQRDALDEEEEFQNHLDQCGACPRCEKYEDVKNCVNCLMFTCEKHN